MGEPDLDQDRRFGCILLAVIVLIAALAILLSMAMGWGGSFMVGR